MSTDDEVLRAGFTVASDLVSDARREADTILDDAARRADLLVVKADRAAAAKQSEAEIYLQKARAVLEIAQQRASNRPRVLSLIDADPQVEQAADERLDLTETEPAAEARLDLTEAEPELVAEAADSGDFDRIPAGFDRLLGDAVSAAVANSVASTRRARR